MPKKIKEIKKEEEKLDSIVKPVEKPLSSELQQKTVVPQPKSLTTDQISRRVKDKAEQMKDQLDAQVKISILLPLEKGEKKGAVQSFCINGYRFTVPKGVMTSVPEQVAQMVSERYNVELDVRSRAIGQGNREAKEALDE